MQTWSNWITLTDKPNILSENHYDGKKVCRILIAFTKTFATRKNGVLSYQCCISFQRHLDFWYMKIRNRMTSFTRHQIKIHKMTVIYGLLLTYNTKSHTLLRRNIYRHPIFLLHTPLYALFDGLWTSNFSFLISRFLRLSDVQFNRKSSSEKYILRIIIKGYSANNFNCSI